MKFLLQPVRLLHPVCLIDTTEYFALIFICILFQTEFMKQVGILLWIRIRLYRYILLTEVTVVSRIP